jgi:hypothetical protein
MPDANWINANHLDGWSLIPVMMHVRRSLQFVKPGYTFRQYITITDAQASIQQTRRRSREIRGVFCLTTGPSPQFQTPAKAVT